MVGAGSGGTAEIVSPFAAVAAGARVRAYEALARGGPVQRVPLPDGSTAWLVTGHAEVRQVLADDRLVKAPTPMRRIAERVCPEVVPAITSHMLNADGETHARLRRLVGAAFTRRRIDALAPRVEAICAGLLDEIAAAGAGGAAVDLVAAYAFPLPMTVICELVGVPEAQRPEFRERTETMLAANFVAEADVAAAMRALVALLRDLVTERRAAPGEDLLSALIAVSDEDGDRLREDEVTSMVWLLVAAGHETTVNLLGNGVAALLAHPEQLERLRAEPDLLPGAVEELLRYEGPVQVTFPLRPVEPVEVGGVEIPAEEVVLPALIAANRDPERIEAPGELAVDRSTNPHLAFGHGIHHCLGAPLARLEARIALARLLERFPGLRLAVDPGELTWRPSFLMHGLTTLPVHVD